MAGDLLMSISQDERERAVFRSRRMYQTDRESDIATAEDRGKNMGRKEQRIEIAQKLLEMNLSFEQIITATGLTREDLETLRTHL